MKRISSVGAANIVASDFNPMKIKLKWKETNYTPYF